MLRFFGGGTFANTLRYFEELAGRYGPIASFRILGRRLHLVTKPEFVREILVVQQHKFTRANGAAVLCDLLGDGLLTAQEPRHREHRRTLQPAFHAQRIANYAQAMTQETVSAIEPWRSGDSVDISAAMMRLALAIVGRALFGADVRDSAGALEDSLGRAMRIVSWLGPILEALPVWANELRRRLPLPANAHLARARREMSAVIAELVERRAAVGEVGDDLLSMLVAAHQSSGPLDLHAVADELVTFLLAGHETTANVLAWSWYLLAVHPQIEARVCAEVCAALNGDDREPAAADLPRLRFTAQVFSETLRLYPPASAFGRRALELCRLGDYEIAPGDGVVLSPYVSHRDPSHFPEPQTFDPDRWSDSCLPAFAYFPFGGGSRGCIGEAFARLEGTLVLASIARRFRFTSTGSPPPRIAAHATLRPSHPIVRHPAG